jgi:hypothetical protein
MEGGAITAGRTLTMLAMASVAFPGAPALAGRPPMTVKQQMIAKTIDCMRKRMSIDKAVSYNEAAKICNDQIRKQRDQSTPAALAASGQSTKP